MANPPTREAEREIEIPESELGPRPPTLREKGDELERRREEEQKGKPPPIELPQDPNPNPNIWRTDASPRHGFMMAASSAGYSREEIVDHLAGQRQKARDAGYTDAEIDQHVGWTWPGTVGGEFDRRIINTTKALRNKVEDQVAYDDATAKFTERENVGRFARDLGRGTLTKNDIDDAPFHESEDRTGQFSREIEPPFSGVPRGQFGRLALDPEKVLDIGRAGIELAQRWFSSIDRLMGRGIVDPEHISHDDMADVLTAATTLTPGTARALLGEAGELGALGGRPGMPKSYYSPERIATMHEMLRRQRSGLADLVGSGAEPPAGGVLSPHDIEDALALRNAGVPMEPLAEHFGVTRDALYKRFAALNKPEPAPRLPSESYREPPAEPKKTEPFPGAPNISGPITVGDVAKLAQELELPMSVRGTGEGTTYVKLGPKGQEVIVRVPAANNPHGGNPRTMRPGEWRIDTSVTGTNYPHPKTQLNVAGEPYEKNIAALRDRLQYLFGKTKTEAPPLESVIEQPDSRQLRLLAGNVLPPGYREAAHEAGYTDEEIDEHFGIAPKPVPRRLLDRLNLGDKMNTVAGRVLSAIPEGFREGIGDPYDLFKLEPGGATEQWLQRNGLMATPGNPATPLFMSRVLGGVAASPEVAMNVVSKIWNGLNTAGGNVLKQIEEEFGREETEANRDKREFINMGNFAPLALGYAHGVSMEFSGGKPVPRPTGPLPSDRMYIDASKEITGGPERDRRVEAKLEYLHNKHGMLPSEIVEDAKTDPSVRASLLSRGTDLPDKYVPAEEQPKPSERPKNVPPDAKQGADGRWYHSWPEGTPYESVYSKAGIFLRNTGGHPPDIISPGMEQIRKGIEAAGEKSGELPAIVGKEGEEAAPGERRLGAMVREPQRGGGGGAGGGEPPIEGGPLGEGEGEPRRIEGPAPTPLTPDRIAQAHANIEERLSIGETSQRQPLTLKRLYTYFVDKLFPMSDVINTIDPDLETWNHAYRLARMYAGIAGKAHEMLFSATFDFNTYKPTGKSLQEILEPVKNDLSKFRRFATSARAMELVNRGMEPGMPMEDARIVVATRDPLHARVLQELYEYQDRVAAYYRDSGMMSQKAYEAMVAANRYFVPFHRIFEQEGIGIARVGTGLQAQHVIKRIEGSERRVIDPIESVIKNTHLLVAMAEKNAIARTLIETLLDAQAERKPTPVREVPEGVTIAGKVAADERTPLAAPTGTEIVKADEPRRGSTGTAIANWIRQMGVSKDVRDLSGMISDLADHGGPEDDARGRISIWRDGQKEDFYVDPELARSFKNLDRPTIGWIERALTPLASTLRAGAVLNLPFLIRHMVRDYAYALGTTAKGIFTPVDMWKGIAGQLRVTEDWHDYMRGGGHAVSYMALDRRYLQTDQAKLTGETGLWTRAYNVVVNPDSSFVTKTGTVLGLPFKATSKYVLHPLQLAFEVAAQASHYGAYLRERAAQRGEMPISGALPGPEARGALPRQPGGPQLRGPAGPGVAAEEQPAQLGHPIQERDTFPNPYGGDRDLPHPEGQDLRIREGATMDEAMREHARRAGGWRPPGETPGEIGPIPEQNKRDIQHAVWVARDTAVDAARIGALTRSINLINAFANIKIQDTDRVARAEINNPISATLKFGLGITLPAYGVWLWGHNDSRYRDAPDWQKDLFYLIPTNNWVDATPAEAQLRKPDMVRSVVKAGQLQMQVNNGWMIRIPKPFAAGMVFGTLTERTLDKFFENNPEAYKSFLHSLKEQTIGDVLPTELVPFLEKAMNRSVLTGHTLVPDHLEKGLPEYQYLPYTSEFAKRLGQMIGEFPGYKSLRESLEPGSMAHGLVSMAASPIHIENMIRGWSGELGKEALHLADFALRKAGMLPDPTYPEKRLWENPIIEAFNARYPTSSPQVIQDFYDRETRAQEYFTSWQNEAKQGHQDAMKRIEAAGGPGIFAQLTGMRQAIGAMNHVAQMIYDNPNMQPYEKRQQIDSLYWQMQMIGEQGKKVLDDMDRKAQQNRRPGQ